MSESTAHGESRKDRLVHELKSYAVISVYLFVCFGVILFYDASSSPARQADAVGIGAAIVKALVIGKFILIGELFKPGSRVEAPTVLRRIAWRTLGMLVVLVILKILEEIVVGAVHGLSVGEALTEMFSQSWQRIAAPTLLMMLILIPLMAAIELDRELGEGGLRNILLRRGG